MLDRNDINNKFKKCIHCSQIVLGEVAEQLGYDREEAMRMAAPFGGGMFHGDTCGAVCGAMIAIGMRYGHCEEGDTAGNAVMVEKTNAFQQAFIAKHGSTICRDLIGYDLALPGQLEEALASGKIFSCCPEYVNSALEILEELL